MRLYLLLIYRGRLMQKTGNLLICWPGVPDRTRLTTTALLCFHNDLQRAGLLQSFMHARANIRGGTVSA